MSYSIWNAFQKEAGAELLKLLRAPEFFIPTLVMPSGFYALFAIALPGSHQNAEYMLATFGVFAVMGPSLFGFGVGVANERARGWLDLKRASPAPGIVYIASKLTATLLFASVSLGLVYVIAGFGAGVVMEREVWVSLFGVQLLASLPFVLLGLTLGFSFKSNAAVAVTNLVFMVMSALGGLWSPVVIFPPALQSIAQFLPSYHLAEIALFVGQAPGTHHVMQSLVVVLAMTGGLAALALFSWARQRSS
jgi:ABC-2 type transport system permease protein